MKTSNKIFIMLLTIAMLISAVTVYALATETHEAKIGDTEYATISDAIDAVNAYEGEDDITVTLLTDVTLTKSVEVTNATANVIIDLAGKTVNTGNKYGFYAAAEGVSMTVKNGNVKGTSVALFKINSDYTTATLTVDGVVATNEAANAAAAVVTAEGGKIVVKNSKLSATQINTAVVRQDLNGLIEVYSSELYSMRGKGGGHTSLIKHGGTATLTADSFEGSTGYHVYLENCYAYAVRIFIRGYVGENSATTHLRETGTNYVNTTIMVKGCEIEQYTKEEDTASGFFNASYHTVSFEGSHIELAAEGFAVGAGDSVTLKNCEVIQTGKNAKKNTGYIFLGKGSAYILNTKIYAQLSGKNLYFAKLSSNVVETAITVGEGTYINWANEAIMSKLTYDSGCTYYKEYLNTNASGYFVSSTPYTTDIHLLTDFEQTALFSHTPTDHASILAGTKTISAVNSFELSYGSLWQVYQGQVTIEEDYYGNRYMKYDPTVVNPGEATDAPEYYDKLNIAAQPYVHWIDGAAVSISTTGYFVMDYDFKSGDKAFFPVAFYVQSRSGSTQGSQNAVKINADGTIGNKKLDLDTWYHMTVVLQVIRDTDGNVTGSLTKYYVNGEYVGEKADHISTATATGSLCGLRAYLGSNTALSEGMAFCMDNVVTTVYGVNYTDAAVLFTAENKSLENWSGAYYNKTDREIPKNNPIAAVNDTVYDNVTEALNAVEDGDTLYLFTNVEGLVNVTKAITVVTSNKFNYTSATHKATPTENGVIFTAAQSNEILDVYFVNSNDINEFYKATFAYGNKILYNNQIETPDVTFDFDNATVSGFVGWTSDIGAENPTIVTEFPIAGTEHGTMLAYYTVFKTENVDFIVTNANGEYVSSGVGAQALEATCENMAAGCKLTLCRDVALDTQTIDMLKAGTYYFDLYGNTLSCTFASANKAAMFLTKVCSFYLYSSKSGAVVDIKATDATNKGAPMVNVHADSKVYIGDAGENAGKGYGDNLTVYACTAVEVNHTRTETYVGGGTYVRTVNDYTGLMIVRTASPLTIKDATLYSKLTEGSVLIHLAADGSSLTLDNCNVVATLQRNGNSQTLFNGYYAGSAVTINKCTFANVRLAAANETHGSMTLTGVNKLTSAAPDYATVPTGYELVKYNGKLNVSGVEFIAPYALINPTDAVSVTWQNADGSEIATEKYMVGGNAIYSGASLDVVNDFYTRTHLGWDKALENVTGNVIFKAVYEDKITADIKGVVHNMTITENLDLNIYVPAGDAIASISISTDGSRQDIKGEVKNGYYVITKSYNPNKVSVEFVLYVTVKVGDLEDVYEIHASVLSYALKVLTSDITTNSDKALMMDMLVYANEASKYFDGEEDEAVKAVVENSEYSEFINTTDFNLEGVTPVDVSGIRFAITGARLSLTSTPSFVFTVADSYSKTITIEASFLTEALVLTPDGNGTVTVPAIFYKNLGENVIIWVSDADGVAIGAGYNLASYALAEETDCRALSLALCIFANTAKNYQ